MEIPKGWRISLSMFDMENLITKELHEIAGREYDFDKFYIVRYPMHRCPDGCSVCDLFYEKKYICSMELDFINTMQICLFFNKYEKKEGERERIHHYKL